MNNFQLILLILVSFYTENKTKYNNKKKLQRNNLKKNIILKSQKKFKKIKIIQLQNIDQKKVCGAIKHIKKILREMSQEKNCLI